MAEEQNLNRQGARVASQAKRTNRRRSWVWVRRNSTAKVGTDLIWLWTP